MRISYSKPGRRAAILPIWYARYRRNHGNNNHRNREKRKKASKTTMMTPVAFCWQHHAEELLRERNVVKICRATCLPGGDKPQAYLALDRLY